MVFLYPQNQHPLIPQAHSPEDDLCLAREIKDFRQQFFRLLQSKIEELSCNYSEPEQPESLYRHLRQELDASPEIEEANQRRSILQDRLWDRVSADINRDCDRLTKEFEFYRQGKGKLELNPHLEFPAHQLKVDIHRMPGGYLQDRGEDDFGSGVMYDHGIFLYGKGWLGPLNDEFGYTLIHNILCQRYREFNPHKILDLGCSVGHSTLPYVSEYPEAEVWGIDLGASLLRYASARANALNQKVYFSQQNAEKTEFEDNSFNLVVSHILLHEIPGGARKRIFAESYRLLDRGGIMVHLDSKSFLSPPTLAARYFRDTEVRVNSEPFLASSKFEDFSTYALEAGFEPADFDICYVPGYYAEKQGNKNAGWVAFCAVKR